MLKPAARKILRLLVVLLVTSVLTFFMLDQLPGDLAYILGGLEALDGDIEMVRLQLGLNENILVRYFKWLGNILIGEWGISHITGETTLSAIALRLPVTLELLVLSLSLALLLAVCSAIVSALNPGGLWDQVMGILAFGSLALPGFVMAIALIGIFSLWLGWFPVMGYSPLSEGVAANIRSLFLPVLSLALIEWVPLYRVLRSDLIATLNEDFILLARAKGLSETRILLRHALRPSSITLCTILGLQVGQLIGGALVIETVFALPGMGQTLIMAIYDRDLFIVQGCILIITLGYVLTNMVVDWITSRLDPRIRLEGRHG